MHLYNNQGMPEINIRNSLTPFKIHHTDKDHLNSTRKSGKELQISKPERFYDLKSGKMKEYCDRKH